MDSKGASIVVLVLYSGLASTLVASAHANAFLRAGIRGAAEQVTLVDVENALSSEIADALGGGYGAEKLSNVEAALRPMFDTLPKNEHGNLGHAVVRYALHRFFVKKHGWFVNGLESAGSSQNTSSPTGILKDRVPDFIQGMFEQRLGGNGLDLRHLAILASTIEHLVHDEAMGRLQASYSAHGLLHTDFITEQEAGGIIDAYMMSQILGINLTALNQRQLSRMLKTVGPKAYPGWLDTQEWLRDMQGNVVYADRGINNPFASGELSFPRVAHIVEEIGDRYGTFQDLECQGLKEALMERESDLPGRVQLADFYKTGLGGKFLFTESVEYLRELGALDESDVKRPSVVVPNYLYAKSNCLGKSTFYSVCCISQCEELLSHLENKIAMPTSEPKRIAAVVAGMSSDTVDAPRNLSSSLLDRLDSIAQRHGGQVPLHGRLFAQWMHHAYPNECPYPQIMSSTEAEVDRKSQTLSQSEMEMWVSNAVSQDEADVDVTKELPWMDVEDLLVELETSSEVAQGGLWSMLRKLCFLGALISLAVSMVRTYTSALARSDDTKFEKYSV
jgi:hypothetical protein